MRRIATTCAVVCLVLMSTGQSAANVSMPFPDWRAEPEVVDNRSCVLDAQFGCTAIASPGHGSSTWPSPYPLSGDIVIDDTVGGAVTIRVDALYAPGKSADSAGADKVNVALHDSSGLLWPTISTRPAGDFGSGRTLPPNAFAGVHTSNIAYAYMDLTDLGNTSTLDDLAFQPHLPSGAIVLGGIAVGLIGWLWRRRNFSCEKYP